MPFNFKSSTGFSPASSTINVDSSPVASPLISRGGRYYGEVEFKLDPRTPDYVRMKNRLFSRVFGEYSPSTGDLVLSKTGEFLGIMVNSDYCAVLNNFNTFPRDNFNESTTLESSRVKLEELRARLDRLPMALW